MSDLQSVTDVQAKLEYLEDKIRETEGLAVIGSVKVVKWCNGGIYGPLTVSYSEDGGQIGSQRRESRQDDHL